MKIFISCSNHDKEIADILMAYFDRSFNISYDDMYNCFVGKSTPVGSNYHEYIKNAIMESDVNILLITNESLKSKYCLCELGASWVLNKKTILVFIEPASFSEMINTPMDGIQAWSVNLRVRYSIDKLISEFMNEFRTLLKNESKSDHNMSKNEAVEDLYRLSYTREIPKPISLLNCIPFHENSDPTTLKLSERSHSSTTARIDFQNSKPKFVGFYIDLKYEDWSGLLYGDYTLNCSIKSTAAIRGVTLEFKSQHQGRELFKFAEYRMELSKNDLHTYPIRLRDVNDDEDNWKNMKELVFLFTPEDVDEVGTITLMNLEFNKGCVEL